MDIVSSHDDNASMIAPSILSLNDDSDLGRPYDDTTPLIDRRSHVAHRPSHSTITDYGSSSHPQVPAAPAGPVCPVSSAVWVDDAVANASGDNLPPEIRVKGRALPTQDAGVADGKTKMDAKGATSSGRNLVVCIDGTANQFGLKNTHVVELYSRLVKDEKQLTYYDSGIGTYVAESNIFVRMKQRIEHTVDMAIAINHKRITLSAYQWLSENYLPGDRIYLFGFSRGAYQVRIISGMIEIVGLLHKGNNNQIAFAYQLYLAMVKVERGKGKVSTMAHTKKLCAQFKRTLSHKHFQVHFVGAWDTVSSIGVTRGQSFPETTSGMGHVRTFRHAISLNERRIKFLPEHANGGAGPKPGCGDVKEVWFVGSHSDIGGGNDENMDLDHFGPSLRWMLYEAIDHGLYTEPYQGGWSDPDPKSSMRWYWWILEVLPLKRLSYSGEAGASTATCYWPHIAAPRRVQAGQLIHESAIEYLRKEALEGSRATQTALILKEKSWCSLYDILPHLSEDSNLIERDSHSKMVTELFKTLDMSDPDTEAATFILMTLISRAVGQQALVDRLSNSHEAGLILKALRITSEDPALMNDDEKQRKYANAFAGALALLQSRPEGLQTQPTGKLLQWLRLTAPDTQSRVMHTFCSIPGNNSSIFSVVYSPNGKLIASGSADGTIQLRDAVTGQPIGEPLQAHEGMVLSVAFSPDGKRIVSGSGDLIIRIWEAETRQPVRAPLTGHENWVRSVTVSPDGKLIASGSSDGTIRIWDAQTGRAVGEPLRGHIDYVLSVAFSPDGRRIASGSIDSTVRIWDVETREVVRVLEGHSRSVWSVVFSPDGRRIVSGSGDWTIRVWDVETGETVLGPLEGHTGGVFAVAVSPDGRYIASGSYDNTVRLWSARTGEVVGEPLRGHGSTVRAVAFSPDSRRIVSGSDDNSLMIWEVA